MAITDDAHGHSTQVGATILLAQPETLVYLPVGARQVFEQGQGLCHAQLANTIPITLRGVQNNDILRPAIGAIHVLQPAPDPCHELQRPSMSHEVGGQSPTAHHDAFHRPEFLGQFRICQMMTCDDLMTCCGQPLGQQGMHAIHEDDPHAQGNRSYMRWPTVKYVSRPKMSFRVVTKGPVANAGSTFRRSMASGITVPNMAAVRITLNRAMLTV
jgi:hypothetical protein